MAAIGKIKSTRKIKIKPTSKKVVITSHKSIAPLFGINKKEIDGLEFQKKVRNEWQ
jgi:hypothetical protein